MPLPMPACTALRPTTLASRALAACAALAALPASAALVARNLDANASTAEAYYDTALGITWMRDVRTLANAYGLPVGMNYASATTALANFNADASLNHGHSAWRLPSAAGVHTIGGLGCQFGLSGHSDCGENVDVASSELAHLFHATLGNLSARDTSGQQRAGTQFVDWGLADSGDFDNFDAMGFWTGTTSFRLIFGTPQNGQVVFQTATGTQAIGAPSAMNAAWLVHDGDIGSALAPSAVPLPGTLALATLALTLLLPRRRS